MIPFDVTPNLIRRIWEKLDEYVNRDLPIGYVPHDGTLMAWSFREDFEAGVDIFAFARYHGMPTIEKIDDMVCG